MKNSPEKICAFPGCDKNGESRGDHRGRWRWCHFHRKGAGRKERKLYAKGLDSLT